MGYYRDSYENAGPSIPKMALRVFGYTLLAGVMSLFLSISVNMLSTAFLEDTIGYKEVEIIRDESGAVVEQRLLETVYFDENTTYEDQKVTADDDREISREMITQPKNDVCAVLVVVVRVLLQAAMLALLLGIPGYFVRREGDRDRNLVEHHDAAPKPLRGLWIGLLASIPSALVYALLLCGKAGLWTESVQGIYRFLNTPLLPIVNLIMPLSVFPATSITASQLLLLFLLLLLVPLACAVAYQMGYHRLFTRKKHRQK